MLELKSQDGPQRQFAGTGADVAIYGGSAGGGKTWALAFEALRNVRIPGYAAIFFRRTSPQLTGGGSIWEETREMYPIEGGTPNETHLRWRFPSGAMVQFSHLQRESDKYTHQGKEYALICFDELTHFTESQFWYLFSRNRSTCGVRPYIRATTNPDPDSFVRGLVEWWIDPETGLAIPERSGVVRWVVRDRDSGELFWADKKSTLLGKSKMDPVSFTFIAASLDDNKALLKKDPAYRSKLELLSKVERERLLGGNWNIKPAAGLYFRDYYFEVVDAAPADVRCTWRAWDKAGTERSDKNKDPDFTVGVKYSKLKNGTFCIEHASRFQASPLKVEQNMLNVASQDGRKTKIALWQDPGQAGKTDVAHFKRLLSKYVVKSVVARDNKVTYSGPVSAQAEAGNIIIVRGDWNKPFLKVLEEFPDGSHDDDVDSLSLAHIMATTDKAENLRKMAGR